MTKQNLPPITAANEPLHHRIQYLEMLLRLLLSGISSGEFDGDDRQEWVNAIRQQV